MTEQTKQHLMRAALLAILLLAAAVRFHNLGAQSLWYDEGVTYGHSQRTLLELLPALQDNVHVPAYFGSLAVWEDVAGSSEFALRLYSALWSIISVAATYALGRRLFSRGAGLAAALVVALNTFSIYYAQEARMYAMLAAVSALALWVFVGWVQHLTDAATDGTQRRSLIIGGLALAAFNTLGAYTHYSYALTMLVQGALALLWLGWLWMQARRDDTTLTLAHFWRGLLFYTVSNLLMLALFAPWLTTAISQVSAQPNLSETVALPDMIRILLGWLAFGITRQQTMGGMVGIVVFLLIFGLIGVPQARSRQCWRVLLPVVWVSASCGIYIALGLYTRYLRFLLPAQIGLALWLGGGMWTLWQLQTRSQTQVRYLPRMATLAAMAVLSLGLARGLTPLYSDDAFQRDDYRQIANTIEAEADPDDAIILSAPGLQEIFGYYYDGALPVYPLPLGADIAADTQQVIDAHERVYVVLYGAAEQDPQGMVTRTLNANAFQISEQWIGDVRLVRYAPPATFDDSDQQTIAATFGDSITLERAALSTQTVSPNDALQVQLVWSTDAPLETRYKVFLQLLDANGALVAQRDSEPGGGAAPTTLWQAGEPVVDNHALAIPAELTAGDYTLIVGLYDVNNPQARLAIDSSDETAFTLATVTVTP